MSGNSDPFYGDEQLNGLKSNYCTSSAFSFYNFSRNPKFFLKQTKVKEFEFPPYFNLFFNINNLLYQKDDENVDDNVQMADAFVESAGVNNVQIGMISQNIQEKDNTHEQQFTQQEIVDDFEFFDQNNHYNIYSEKDNSVIMSENSQLSSSQKSENFENKFKILALKPSHNQLSIPAKEIQPVISNNSANKKMITREFYSQQISNICNVSNSLSTNLVIQNNKSNIPHSVKNAVILEFENKVGFQKSELECPNYELFSEENLKEEMKKFGMKPGSQKFMVKQLKSVWNFINLNQLPEHLRTELSKFLSPPETAVIQSNSNSNSFNSYSQNGNVSVKHLNEVKKEKIISTIMETQTLWIKILTFKKIEIKEVKEVLNKKGIIVENEILKGYLSELGVIFNQPRV